MAGMSSNHLIAEFLGTFLLVFTIGCNVLSSNPNWGGVSIASVLMVSIYALGSVSGANFNPAVSLALALAGKLEGGMKQFIAYSLVQLAGGFVAAVAYGMLFFDTIQIGPTKGFLWWQAMACEVIYSFVLCFVVLNTAASKKNGGKNQFYGLAIGWVIVAGAYGAGAISGGCFNPAVALAIETQNQFQLGWSAVYAVSEFIGAVIAVIAFKLMRPEEESAEAQPDVVPSLQSKLIAELLGTFVLVFTVGMNVLVESKAAAFSIAASLMVMIYACGDISGAHFNPAVTMAILLSGRGKICLQEAGLYMITQIFAGVVAAFVYAGVHGNITFQLGPGAGFDWGSVGVAETIFTFVLCFVVLCVATVPKNPAPELTGFIVGMCITTGGLAIGSISGGSLNPAVSIGIAAARKFLTEGRFQFGIIYSGYEFIGAFFAAFAFRATHPDEFTSEAEGKGLEAEGKGEAEAVA
jgi:aquaporin Z